MIYIQTKGLKEILHNRIQAWLGPDVYIPHCHVLDSHYPYGIHTDAQQAGFTFAPHPAWTVIIPLEDYNSKTYVFNEPSVQKTPEEHREVALNYEMKCVLVKKFTNRTSLG